jgi:hypothetical protein
MDIIDMIQSSRVDVMPLSRINGSSDNSFKAQSRRCYMDSSKLPEGINDQKLFSTHASETFQDGPATKV